MFWRSNIGEVGWFIQGYESVWMRGPLIEPANQARLVDALFAACEASEGYSLRVDLEAQQVATPNGSTYGFEVDAFRKHCLLNGLDDIGLTLTEADAIRAYEARRSAEAPWLFAAGDRAA